MTTIPASSHQADTTAALQRHLESISELELTQDFLIPLFQRLGYADVQYVGGPDEYGKDVVCWKSDDFGERELAVLQVKRFRLTRRAADSRTSFSEMVTQVSQALEKSVPYSDGLRYARRTYGWTALRAAAHPSVRKASQT